MMDERFSTARQFYRIASDAISMPNRLDPSENYAARVGHVLPQGTLSRRMATCPSSGVLRPFAIRKHKLPARKSRPTAFRFCSTKRTFEVPGQACRLNPLCS